jgi:streptogramin lyase
MELAKREFLLAGAGLGFGLAGGAALAATAPAGGGGRRNVERRMAKTTTLFKAPGAYPNALAINTDAPGGLWIGQQKISQSQAEIWGRQPLANRDEAAWLVDWNGKLIKSVNTPSRNTSGMAYGGGYIWMGANDAPEGIFQVALDGRVVSHRQIPLALPDAPNGGGCHGCQWHEGKLWVASTRLGAMMRIDPTTWLPDALLPVSSAQKPRLHDLTFDDEGNMWVITGTNARSYAEAQPGLNKYDGKTGQLLMTVDFVPNSADPHGLVWHDGHLVSCDAGCHPNGWKDMESPYSLDVFRIDFV